MSKKYIVAGIGEMLWDIFGEEKELGGAPLNFAYHASQLKAKSYMISAIGKDKNGKEILQIVNDLGLSSEFIQEIDYPTGKVKVSLNNIGEPSYEIIENVAWDNLALTDEIIDLAKKLDAICFGTLASRTKTSQETITEVLKNTKQDCLRVFDINLRQNFYNKDLIDIYLGFADILKLNDEELDIITKMFDLPSNEIEALDYLIEKYNLKVISLTKGSNGSLLYNGTERVEQKGIIIDICDTVGAGDSFTATLVMGLLKNMSLKEINKQANRVAGFVCTQKGATPILPRELLI